LAGLSVAKFPQFPPFAIGVPRRFPLLLPAMLPSYFHEISLSPLLSVEEEAALSERMQALAVLKSRERSVVIRRFGLDGRQSSEHFHFAGGRHGASRVTPNQFKAAVNVEVHGGSANYLFVDGHVENLPWNEVQGRLGQPGANFLVP